MPFENDPPPLSQPDPGTDDWRGAKALEVLLHIQRQQLVNQQINSDTRERLALIERDMKHIVETMDGRVSSVERRVDAMQIQVTANSVAINDARLQDANRSGMVSGARWIIGIMIAGGASVAGMIAYVIAHLPQK